MNDYLTRQYGRIHPPAVAEWNLAPANAVNFGIAVDCLRYAPPTPVADEAAPHLIEAEPRDTALWPTLFALFPGWRHGSQPTGDCTGWMQEHLLDTLHAVLMHNGLIDGVEHRVAGSSIYTFSKAELYSRYGRKSAGSTGWAVATATQRFGFLQQRNYEVGGKSYDLTDRSWSITWGERDSARVGVPDELEPFAAEHRARDRVAVTDPEMAGKLIQAGYPVQYCGYTYWAMQRDGDGIGSRFSSGWHAMTATGVRWNTDGTVQALWIANTGHGKHCSGAVGPIPMPEVYAECGSWVPRRLLSAVYAAGDCYAHTFVDGWPVLDLVDWRTESYL